MERRIRVAIVLLIGVVVMSAMLGWMGGSVATFVLASTMMMMGSWTWARLAHLPNLISGLLGIRSQWLYSRALGDRPPSADSIVQAILWTVGLLGFALVAEWIEWRRFHARQTKVRPVVSGR